MSLFEQLGPFWTIGIVANVCLTGLAIWWVVRAMRPRKRDGARHPAGEPPSQR